MITHTLKYYRQNNKLVRLQIIRNTNGLISASIIMTPIKKPEVLTASWLEGILI